MRDQLHLMELVDNYLDSTMSNTDRLAFEERLRNSEELRSLVEDQQRLRQAARRSPARAAAKKAYRNYRWGKSLPGMGVGAVVLIAATAALFLWKSPMADGGSENAPVSESEYRTLTDTTGTHLDPLVLTIDPTKDTTLVTPNGIVLDIPQGAFVDSLGAAISIPVRVTLLEALDPLDIMKAGLSTMSGDTLLETGGMFYLDAQANGKAVKIDPAKPLTAMVPADGSKKGMQLYEGVKRDDGVIDWRNPKPLRKSLVPVDITTLNFYPPGYEAKLAELGQDVANKAFKDSLYYSLRCADQARENLMEAPSQLDLDEPMAFRGHGAALAMAPQSQSEHGSLDTVIFAYGSDPCGIDPIKIKTIWNKRFNNTNLATKEFEQRLERIFSRCDNALLDVYVNNLDKDLYWCDSVGTRMGHESMARFLEPAYGRVELPAHAADRLRTFYENNSRAEAEAIRKTQEKFWNEQWKQDVKSDAKRADHAMAGSVREGALFLKELAANLDTVYKQFGYKRVQLPRAAWVVTVTSPGWWNVDKAVVQATTTRSSMSYTDPNNGKTATLTYTPLIVEVAERASYDELVVYLIPNQLNSYQRMNEGAGGFSERLNSIFTYDLFCLGIKGKQQFAFKTAVNGQAEIKAALAPVDEQALRRMIGSKSGMQQELIDEAKHLEWLVGDMQRRKSNADRQALKAAVFPVVFPCSNQPSQPVKEEPTQSDTAE
ncbi:MAG: hypothetical protein KA791_10765 [Flavobacteriales bacterium]|nr:hypothetical protein [Flavobacteriales bacterium]